MALKQVAQRNAPRLLGNAFAINAWRDANREAHETLTKIVDGKLANSDIALDLRQLLDQVADGSGLPPGAADKLPPQLAQLQVMSSDQVDTLRKVVKAFRAVAWLLVALSLACFAGAVALARDRRHTLVSVGLCLIVAGVAVLAVRRLAGKWVVDALADAPNALDAADDVWSIATSLLVDAAQGMLLAGLLVASGAWLAGAGRRATELRRLSAPTLRDQPAVAWTALTVLLLGLVIWSPVPWTGKWLPVLLFAVAAFLWLGWMRRLVLREFPAAPAPS